MAKKLKPVIHKGVGNSASLKIFHAGCWDCAKDWRIKPFEVPFYNIFYVHKGQGTVCREKEKFAINPGDLFFYRKGRHYSAARDPKGSFVVYSYGFELNDNSGSDALRAFTLPDRVTLTPPLRKKCIQYFEAIMAEYHRPSPNKRFFAFGTALQFISETLDWVRQTPAAAKAGGTEAMSPIDNRIQSALDYIENHPAEKISLPVLARKSHLSPVYFAGLFRKEIGRSPMDYVRRRRMELAKSLLTESSESVGEVAYAVGFEDQFHFSRVFHKEVGTTPSNFRKAVREKSKNPFLQ